MKKIVALVLSLVMVLGLATVASAATSYELDYKDAATLTTTTGTDTYTLVPAKAAYVNANDQMVKGNVAYYTNVNGDMYVSCDASTPGAFILYYKDTKTVFDTVVALAEDEYLAVGTAYTNFGKACGQLNNEADTTAKYYTYVNGDGDTVIVKGTGVAAVANDTQLLVDGKLVPVVNQDLTTSLNAHKWVVTKNAKNEVVSAKCSLCALEASWTLNAAAVPAGAIAVPGFGGYLYWNAAPVATDKAEVESAQTFDAGIAMYVGMSVMAAAGSAVVLKKKD